MPDPRPQFVGRPTLLLQDSHEVLPRLQTLTREYSDLEAATQVYRALMPVLESDGWQAPPLAITPAQARRKLAQGIPILQGEDLPLPEGAARRLMVRLAQALDSLPGKLDHDSRRGSGPRHVQHLLEQRKLKAVSVLQHAGVGDHDGLQALAQARQIDADLLGLLAQYTLAPSLRSWARQLEPMVAPVEWTQSRCYICGAEVLLGELQGGTGERHLRCGRCGADWSFLLPGCVFCGNQADTFSHLYPPDRRQEQRVEVCDECRRYLKVVNTFEPSSPDCLFVLDLATLHLDTIAQARGYTPPSAGQIVRPN